MSDPVQDAMLKGLRKMKPADHYSTGMRHSKGILINRDPPISTGWCGNDNCEHQNHKQRRAAPPRLQPIQRQKDEQAKE